MPRSMLFRRPMWLCSIPLLATATAFAQFTASIQGVVQDPTGAGVAKATIHLVNVATGGSTVATSERSSKYSFISLDTGSFKITAGTSGFVKVEGNNRSARC